MKDRLTYLQQALFDNQLDFPQEIQEKLLAYLNLMQQWNRVHNLTAIRDPHEMIMLHIVDSLAINRFLLGKRIIDVGTGGGLPGIPLAMVNPDKTFVLLDSNNKKTLFLNQVVIDLKLQNVQVIHSRVEDYRPETCFDSVITRAFSTLKNMLEMTTHLVCQQGQFLAMKGVYPEDEIQEVPDSFRVMSVHALKINGLNAERHLVCVEKTQ